MNRPLAGGWELLVEKINESRVPILSIDVPSGLSADTGNPQGTAVRATVTLTLAAPKRGLLSSEAWPYVGRLELASDIGLVAHALTSDLQWAVREDFVDFPPGRPVAGHKGTFGHLVIFAGSLGYHGAAVLAARAALRAHPGLVSVFTSDDVYLPVASQLQSAMVHPWRPGRSLPDTATAVVFGPGLAASNLSGELRSALLKLWNELPIPVIVDASGLIGCGWRSPPKGPRVITPHPGEAARLLASTVRCVQGDRPGTVRELSKRCGGSSGIERTPNVDRTARREKSLSIPRAIHCSRREAAAMSWRVIWRADAQPQLQADLLTALRYAVWQHGATADSLTGKQKNWTVEDHLAALGNLGD